MAEERIEYGITGMTEDEISEMYKEILTRVDSNRPLGTEELDEVSFTQRLLEGSRLLALIKETPAE